MVINENSQLGLRFKDKKLKEELAKILYAYHERKLNEHLVEIKQIEERLKNSNTDGLDLQDFIIPVGEISTEKRKDMFEKIDLKSIIDDQSDCLNFLICESVYKAAELIKVGSGFTSRTFKDINFGKYTYLMGKNKMVKFICTPGYMYGVYFDDKNKVAFQWVLDIETGEYIFPEEYLQEFSQIMQVIIFVELGDVKIKILNPLQKTEGPKSLKTYNSSNISVYIVDSSWNQIIIRTEGFAVRGHFKLQPCGEGLKDRKLIWVDAFEKTGYRRRAKLEIISQN